MTPPPGKRHWHGGRAIPIEQRFWTKVQKSDGCWLWTATKTKGYGMILGPNRIPLQAHRVAWRLTFGDIPSGLSVLHHCDVPLCVNPAHLWLGTQKDNLEDAERKGRRYGFWKMNIGGL